jgi:5-methylthioadenosine/S-adenosylhomocysteine deaminase
MTRIVVKNATILTLDEKDTFYYPGFIDIRDDKIFKIGSWSSEAALEEYAGETTVIDGTDKLVMPGLVDLHFHTSVAKVGAIYMEFRRVYF